jgi:hypothetical protein
MKRKNLIYLVVLLTYLILTYFIFYVFEKNDIIFLAKEGSVFETLGAFGFLLTSLFFFYLFKKSSTGNNCFFFKTKKNLFFLLLGMLFFIGFGEEISWGQRIFNLQTPEAVKKVNMQGELNIHNLNIFHGKTETGQKKTFVNGLFEFERLFSLFWFSFCFLIPIGSKYNKRIWLLLKEMNLPIGPIFLGFLFLANYLFAKFVEASTKVDLHHYVVEIKESNFSILFLAMSLYFFQYHKNETNFQETTEV